MCDAPIDRIRLKALLFILILILPSFACGRRKEVKPRNLLLITVDTLRADRLGCTGRDRAKTPVIDDLASEGVLFDCCIVTTPITLPSHASIMTGLLPFEMKVRDNKPFSLSKKARTLSEVLKDHGFSTHAVVSGEPLAPGCGLEQGFDTYRFRPGARRSKALLKETPADVTTNLALEALKGYDGSSPLFLWVHYFDPHFPYEPPAKPESGMSDAYDGEVAFVDRQIGRLLKGFGKQKLLDDTLIALTSDHGEGLGEHGEPTHAFFLFDTTLKVPLILKGPGVAPRKKSSAQILSQDIRDTLLLILDIPPEAPLPGAVELAAFARSDGGTLSSRPAFSESLYCFNSFRWAQMTALRTKGTKLIRGAHDMFFDLKADPGETRSLSGETEGVLPLVGEMDKIKSTARNRFEEGPVLQADLPGYFGGTPGDGGIFLPDVKNRSLPHPPGRAAWIRRFLDAVACNTGGNLNRARSLLAGLVGEDGENPTALFWLGRTMRDMGEREGDPRLIREAFGRFREVLRIDPQNRDTFHMSTWCLLQLGSFEEAKEALDRWRSRMGADAGTWELYGHLYSHTASGGKLNPLFDFQKGLEFFNRSLEERADNPRLLQVLIQLCGKQGDEILEKKYSRMLERLKRDDRR